MAPFASSVSSSFIQLLVLSILFSCTSAGWVLQDNYTPSNFFSEFTFFTGADPTNGLVSYQSQSAAQQQGLINTNGGQIYMGVDHTNAAPNGRASVRVTSQKTYNAGTLMVLDLAHMPQGLGTWPAFWTVGPNWPNSGEIDIIEGVNNQATNAMTLHTASGCSLGSTSGFSGRVATNDCFISASGQPNNAGCSIDATATDTYGAGLNAIGGGVYAMEWTDSAISIYFFPRGSIPSDISSGNPNPSGWGQPLSQFTGGCNIPQFFQNHQIVFDTTFCGDWAGNVWSTSGGQSATYPTCNSYVANNPSAFVDAYWQINSLKVYTVSSNSDAPAAASTSNVPATTAEAGVSSQNNNPQTSTTANNDKSTSTVNNNPQSTTVNNNPATPTATQVSGGAVPLQVTGTGSIIEGSSSSNNDGQSSSYTHHHHHHSWSSANPTQAQNQPATSSAVASDTGSTSSGKSSTGGDVSTGSSSSAPAPAAPAPAAPAPAASAPAPATSEGPQSLQVGSDGSIFEGIEKRWAAIHLTRNKARSPHKHKRHAKRHVRSVGPPGGVWRR